MGARAAAALPSSRPLEDPALLPLHIPEFRHAMAAKTRGADYDMIAALFEIVDAASRTPSGAMDGAFRSATQTRPRQKKLFMQIQHDTARLIIGACMARSRCALQPRPDPDRKNFSCKFSMTQPAHHRRGAWARPAYADVAIAPGTLHVPSMYGMQIASPARKGKGVHHQRVAVLSGLNSAGAVKIKRSR